MVKEYVQETEIISKLKNNCWTTLVIKTIEIKRIVRFLYTECQNVKFWGAVSPFSMMLKLQMLYYNSEILILVIYLRMFGTHTQGRQKYSLHNVMLKICK